MGKRALLIGLLSTTPSRILSHRAVPDAERMTLLDLRAAIAELRTKLIGMRLANVYDVSSRTYLLKFSRPGAKFMLLLESGTRIHTTQFTRDKSAIPSGFAMKVRALRALPLAPPSVGENLCVLTVGGWRPPPSCASTFERVGSRPSSSWGRTVF